MILQKKGNYAEAYKYYQQYSAYKDSLLLEGTSRRLASLQYKQNLLKKESEIKLLTKDRQLRDQKAKRQLQLMFGLFAFIVLLVTVLIILSRNNGLRKKSKPEIERAKGGITAGTFRIEDHAGTAYPVGEDGLVR
jgi:two-component system NtrC family sensor kinase